MSSCINASTILEAPLYAKRSSVYSLFIFCFVLVQVHISEPPFSQVFNTRSGIKGQHLAIFSITKRQDVSETDRIITATITKRKWRNFCILFAVHDEIKKIVSWFTLHAMFCGCISDVLTLNISRAVVNNYRYTFSTFPKFLYKCYYISQSSFPVLKRRIFLETNSDV